MQKQCNKNEVNFCLFLCLQNAYIKSCPRDFLYHVTGCHVMHNTTIKFSQQQLMEKCVTDYGANSHLVAVETEEERLYLKDMIENSGRLEK